jgi:hypothetical protein
VIQLNNPVEKFSVNLLSAGMMNEIFLSKQMSIRIGAPIILNDKICLNGVFLNQAYSVKYLGFILTAI